MNNIRMIPISWCWLYLNATFPKMTTKLYSHQLCCVNLKIYRILKVVSATLWSGRYTFSHPRGQNYYLVLATLSKLVFAITINCEHLCVMFTMRIWLRYVVNVTLTVVNSLLTSIYNSFRLVRFWRISYWSPQGERLMAGLNCLLGDRVLALSL